MKRLMFLIFISSCLLFISCIGMHRRDMTENPGSIFCDYRIWGDEEGGNVSVKLQFSLGGPDGPAVFLHPPASILFDGEIPSPDSSRFDGAWYELLKPAEEFGGKHEIVFTDDSSRVYKTAFDFPIISFKNEVPPVITRDDLVFELNGIKNGDRVRLALTDTTFPGKGIERLDTVKDGRILISKNELKNLRNGPINMSLSREQQKWLDNAVPEGGHLYISYGLKREFFLRDSLETPLQ